MIRRGTAVKCIIRFEAPSDITHRDPKLVELIVKAHEATRMPGLNDKPATIDPKMEYQVRNHLARIALCFPRAGDYHSNPGGIAARRAVGSQAAANIRASDGLKQQREMLGFG